mgnify:FL=1|tara:strand:- start:10 stop:390 length:381 start_codon:yes stop_codon:yes gene_type:complete
MKAEITAQILLTETHWFDGSQRKLTNQFDDCCSAWNWIEETTQRAAKRRKRSDREQCRYALYTGETLSGSKYGGVYMVNNARITPANGDYCKGLYSYPFEIIEAWCPEFIDEIAQDKAKRESRATA